VAAVVEEEALEGVVLPEAASAVEAAVAGNPMNPDIY
jgi:hypothetical protein